MQFYIQIWYKIIFGHLYAVSRTYSCIFTAFCFLLLLVLVVLFLETSLNTIYYQSINQRNGLDTDLHQDVCLSFLLCPDNQIIVKQTFFSLFFSSMVQCLEVESTLVHCQAYHLVTQVIFISHSKIGEI